MYWFSREVSERYAIPEVSPEPWPCSRPLIIVLDFLNDVVTLKVFKVKMAASGFQGRKLYFVDIYFALLALTALTIHPPVANVKSNSRATALLSTCYRVA